MFVDTHCHLDLIARLDDEKKPLSDADYVIIDRALHEAVQADVGAFINIGTSIAGSIQSVELAQRYANVYASIGIHPCDCGTGSTNELKQRMQSLQLLLKDKESNKIVAIGEIGLDFFHKPYDKQAQIDFFKAQIELALRYDLPIVIHVRDAADELLRVVEEYVKDKLRGVFHCFLQKKDFADIILDWGFYVGLDAPITYPKNESLRNVFKDIPLERILLETDAPFLPLQQYRGQQNRPVYIPLIAEALANIKGIDVATVETVTTANAQKLFVFMQQV